MRIGNACLALGLTLACLQAQDQAAYTFGTTVVDSGGLEGRIYFLKRGTKGLPNFDRLRPVGTLYTTSLSVWPQNFDEGFPSITERFEWFAIDYNGRFWIENPGAYRFSLLADDGARLYLDSKLVIDNNGTHQAFAMSGGATLTHGVHDIRVQYFQGPRYTVALVLAVAPPGEPWRIFDMKDFKPPNDPDKLAKGEVSAIQATTQ